MYELCEQKICCEVRFLLQVGDYVFAKIMTSKGFDFYVPAIVIALPNHNVASEKFYTVLKCNNRRVSSHPKKKAGHREHGCLLPYSRMPWGLGSAHAESTSSPCFYVGELLGFPCQTAVDGWTGSLWALSLSLSLFLSLSLYLCSCPLSHPPPFLYVLYAPVWMHVQMCRSQRLPLLSASLPLSTLFTETGLLLESGVHSAHLASQRF
jgi:hypothetical protein